ncbi:glycosyltransferase family 4 protein [bacterium]|nr:glycosyltransferase family 4 protein [bacterium]
MARRPHVLLDALLVGPQPTGVGRSILELTAALAASDRGCDFTVLATEAGPFAEVSGADGWRVRLCPGAAGGTLRKAMFTQIQVPRLVTELGATILHSLQFIAPLRPRRPSIVTVHDLAWQDYPGLLETTREWYYRVMVGPSLGRAARILTNSTSTAGDVMRLHPGTRGKVVVTPFGTPSWVWKQDRDLPGRPADDEGYFLFVGTLEPRKNLDNLLAAYADFLAASAVRSGGGPAPDLLLVGARGWRDGELRTRIRDLQATGKLKVRDYCGPEALWGLYRGARALLFPSLHEGFGFPILEAMAAGCPVLTSARGAMLEVGGDAVLAVDPDSRADLTAAILLLATDSGLCRRLSERGLARAPRWTWAETAARTAETYLQVAGETGP